MSRQPPLTDAEAIAHLHRSVRQGTLAFEDKAALRALGLELVARAAAFARQYPTMAAEVPVLGRLARDHALLNP